MLLETHAWVVILEKRYTEGWVLASAPVANEAWVGADAWSVPDYLMDEAIGVLSSKHRQSGPRWHALLKANHFGVDREYGRLVYVLDRNGDPCRGLERGLYAACQVGLVGDHHRQPEGAVHFEIDRLEETRWRQAEDN